MEELRSEKDLLLALLEYTEEDAAEKFPKDIAAMEQSLKQLEEQEVVCRLQKRYSHMMMERSKRNTAWYLHEAAEEGLVWKVTRQRPNRQKQRDDGER